MDHKISNHFAVEWSQDIVDWVMQASEQDDVEPGIAIFATITAAIVIARSVDMDDQTIRAYFEQILTKEFPSDLKPESH